MLGGFAPARPAATGLAAALATETPSLSSLIQDLPSAKKRMGDFTAPEFRDFANEFHTMCDDTIILVLPDCQVVDIVTQYENNILLFINVSEATLAKEMTSQFSKEIYETFLSTLRATPFNFPFGRRSDTPAGFVCLKVKISRRRLDQSFRPKDAYEPGCLADLSIMPIAYNPFKNVTVPGIGFRVARVDNVRY